MTYVVAFIIIGLCFMFLSLTAIVNARIASVIIWGCWLLAAAILIWIFAHGG